MSKFLKVSVRKVLTTDLYVEVPDDFRPEDVRNQQYRPQLGEIAMGTIAECEWDDCDWWRTLAIQDVSEVTEEEAKLFETGRLTNEQGNEGGQ